MSPPRYDSAHTARNPRTGVCDGTAGPPRRGSATGHATAGALDEIRQPFGHARYGDQEDEEDHGDGEEPQQGDEDVAQLMVSPRLTAVSLTMLWMM